MCCFAASQIFVYCSVLFEMQGMCMFHGMKIFTDVASFTFLVKHESDRDCSLKIEPQKPYGLEKGELN